MLKILEEEESLASLKELISIVETTPELISKEDLFKVINHTSCLKSIKSRSIEQIQADPKEFSSLRKVRAFIQGSKGDANLLHTLEDVQKVIEEGKGLRRKNNKSFPDLIEEVLEEAKILEKEFAKLPSSFNALLEKVGFFDLKEELKSFQKSGSAYLQEVDKTLGGLKEKLSIEEEPINRRLGFSWGVFLHPLIENLEPVQENSKVEEELTLCHLYQDVIVARSFVEKHKVSFIDWIEKKGETQWQ